MRNYGDEVTALVICIIIMAAIATLSGLFGDGLRWGEVSYENQGQRTFTTLFNRQVTLSGKGIYANNTLGQILMVRPHDMMLLFAGIPLLVMSLFSARKGSIAGRFLLAGVVGFFLVSYFMYLFIAVYNRLFLIYVGITSLSFYAFILLLLSFDLEAVPGHFKPGFQRTFLGWTLIVISSMIGFPWLSITVPTLIRGTIPADQMEQLTTLPVQAIDLAFFVPSAFLAGVLLLRRSPFGYLLVPPYMFFLTLMMFTLFFKGLSMSIGGISGMEPMMGMTSVLGVLALISSWLILRNLKSVPAK